MIYYLYSGNPVSVGREGRERERKYVSTIYTINKKINI